MCFPLHTFFWLKINHKHTNKKLQIYVIKGTKCHSRIQKYISRIWKPQRFMEMYAAYMKQNTGAFLKSESVYTHDVKISLFFWNWHRLTLAQNIWAVGIVYAILLKSFWFQNIFSFKKSLYPNFCILFDFIFITCI